MSLTWIEASAGTGKTFTLVQTVVQMVMEGLPIEKVLLVTFTEKATAELKTRIRQGLREAWKKTSDPRLAQALEDMASVSITTIHGFCRTLLTQFPLESGLSFEPEMVDQGQQWRRLLRDELRERLTQLDEGLLAWAGLEDEEDLLDLAQEALNRGVFSLPLLHPTGAEQERFLRERSALEAGTGPLWEAIRQIQALGLPDEARQAFGDAFETHLHARNHKGAYRALLTPVDSFRDLPGLLSPDTVKALARWKEGGTVWKGKARPPFPGRLEAVRLAALALIEAIEAWSDLPGVAPHEFLAGTARYLVLEGICRPVLARRSSRELTFHDLIERVRSLVTSPGGQALVQGASSRWQAVLIDEFQDTDPDQWLIFRTLFSDEAHRLFLVGDPKQSIYRFRGADLNVYRQVRAEVLAQGAETRVLEENFRSTEAMIQVLNRWFDPQRVGWEHPDDFRASRKGSKPIASLVRKTPEGSLVVPPLEVYRDADERAWHRHLVQSVLTFLDGSFFLEDESGARPVEPGDILILVRKKREAWVLYRLLTAQGVPATVTGSGGLLQGREAAEVLLFLKALENPRSLPTVRALAWTRLFSGADAQELASALAEARRDAESGAFLRAFRRVAASLEPGVTDGGGLEGLLRSPEGTRIVTNTEHVLELLQERHHRGDIAPGRAALCLETWIRSDLQEDEVDLRRDGESPTLRLMTVHAAKGLEAPIVLHGLPSDPPPHREPWIVASGVDFLKTAEGRQAEENAQKAEELRLRYVALTRASAHQILLDDSEEARPLPLGPDVPASPWVSPVERRLLPSLAPPIPGLETRHPWVESHSGLWRRATRDEEADHATWDRPRIKREDEPAERDGSTLTDSLPAGPVFGDLVHDLLEEADFLWWHPQASQNDQERARVLVEGLVQRNRTLFSGHGARVLSEWIGRTLNHRFSLETGAQLTLATVPREDTRRELEFHLPLATGAPPSFTWGERFLEVHPGYLTGRIDLLVRLEDRLYLIDWKTNRLAPGQTPADLMAEAGYDLQAQWYWEVLLRLAKIQGETLRPAGVLYVFLRGAGDQPLGVFLSPETLAQKTLQPFFREAGRV